MFNERITLINREFHGIIVEGPSLDDPKNRGRYRVKIPELMPHLVEDDAYIWCLNHVHKYRNTQVDQEDEGDVENIEGQYFPLRPGIHVLVKFYKEDYNSGYIDRIVSDYYKDSLPLDLKTEDRDKYYQLLRTIKSDLFAITLDDMQTSGIPSNGIHMYFREDRTVLIINEEGFHVYSKDNLDYQIDGFGHVKIGDKLDLFISSDLNISVGGDVNMKVNGNVKIGVDGDTNLNTNGDTNIESSGDVNVKSRNCNIQSNGQTNIKASGPINMDGGPMINLNCGFASNASSANKPNIPNPKSKTELIQMNKTKNIKIEI